MMKEPEGLFFRTRENGAAVFKVDTENRQRRLEMQQIANVNVANAKINPQGDYKLSADETAEIEAWIAARQDVLSKRQMDDIRRVVDQISYTAHWLQSKATDDEVAEIADELLMAMHDLRGTLVRKMSDKLLKS